MPKGAVLLLLAAVLALAGCGGSGAAGGGGTLLRARLNADILSSDPGMRRDFNTDAVLLHVVEGLVAAREDGTIGPMLARSWTISPDGRVYRFFLRQGVRFHNGAPLTAADVVWSLKRYLAPDSHWRCKSDLSPTGLAAVTDLRALDRYTVEIALDRPAPLFLTTLARIDCGSTGITHRDSVGPDGTWRYPIGTGPFRWGTWRHNDYVELLRYPGYSSLPGPPDGNGGGKKALVDRIRFSIIPDGSAASAALLRGSLDVVDELAANELGTLRGAKGIKLVSATSSDFYAILFQTGDPVLRDPRLRRAIALSLDIAGIARVGTRGTATPNSSPVPVVSPYYGPVERALIRRNLDEARSLVRASGYKGQPIQLITSHSPPEMYDDAILIQAMARQAGIRIDVVTLDWATQLARYADGHYQAMVFGFSARLDPSLMFGVLIGNRATDPRKVWNSPTAIRLLEQSVAESDPKRRQVLFDALDRQFRADVPAIILYSTLRITALRDDVQGYRSWPGQTQRLWNVSIGRRP